MAAVEDSRCHKIFVIFACAVGQFFTLGATLQMSVFVDEVIREFKLTLSEVAILFSVLCCLLFAVGPLVTPLIEHFGYRLCVCIAGVVAFLAQLASAFVHNYVLLIFLWGFITGIAMCVAMTGVTLVPGFYVSEARRHVAFSIIYTGAGLGLTVFPIIYERLIDMYLWRGALWIMSALSLHICIVGVILPETPKAPHLANGKSHAQEKTVWQKIRTALHLDLLKDCKFILVFFACFIAQFCGVGIGTFLFNMLKHQYELSPKESSLALSLFGASSIIGRLLVAMITKSRLPRWWVWSIVCFLFGLISAIVGQFVGMANACIIMVFDGLLIGILFTLHPVVLGDLFAPDALPATFGYCNLAFGMGSLGGPLVAGALFDATRQYIWLTGILGGLMALAFLPAVLAFPILKMIEYSSTAGERRGYLSE